jgi:hypothetical protein
MKTFFHFSCETEQTVWFFVAILLLLFLTSVTCFGRGFHGSCLGRSTLECQSKLSSEPANTSFTGWAPISGKPR